MLTLTCPGTDLRKAQRSRNNRACSKKRPRVATAPRGWRPDYVDQFSIGIDICTTMTITFGRLRRNMVVPTGPSSNSQRWSRFPEQNGGLAKVDSGFDYAANFFSFAWVA